MKALRYFTPLIFALSASGATFDDWIDRLDEQLTVSLFDDHLRSRLSGLLDLEGYQLPQPSPGLIDTQDRRLFNPRLTLFLDTQVGGAVYGFVQARLDRGFDPGDRPAEVRLDEYALRVTPWEDGRVNVQVGKFGSVVGNWMPRHLSWENPFVLAPLPYEHVTPVSDTEGPVSVLEFLQVDPNEKYDHNPVLWGPSYTSGLQVAGRVGKSEAAAELKNAPLASRPESWDATAVGFEHPTVSGRVAYRPNHLWTFGLSASSGSYLRPEAAGLLPPGLSLGDYRETVLGQDVAFAWGRLQVWAELFEARFDVPGVGYADTLAGYIEAKYKLTAQLYAALRWNQQIFGDVQDAATGPVAWSPEVRRFDAALGFRPNAHTQLKLQWSVQHEDLEPRDFDHTLAAQFTLRF